MLKLNYYVVFITLCLFFCATPDVLIAQACATAQKLQQTNFFDFGPAGDGDVAMTSIVNQFGWTGSGSGNISANSANTFFNDNINTQIFTQTVSDVNLKGNGATLTLEMTAGNGGPNFSISTPTTFQISYGGKIYATVNTGAGAGTVATMAYFNLASGNLTTVLNFTTSFTWVINLPAGIPNSGTLQLSFIPTGGVGDDFTVFTVSLQSCPIVYTGTIFDDGDALTDGVVDGLTSNLSGALSVGLYNASNVLVTQAAVGPTGTFSLSAAQSGTYTLRLTGLPAGYVNTGEKLSAEPAGGDGTPNGITSAITITNAGASAGANTDIGSVRFGINGLPQAYATSGLVTGAPSKVDFGLMPPQGSDPEDQPLKDTWSGKTIVITSAPPNGYILKYNGSAVTVGTSITTFVPALLTIEPGSSTPGSSSSASFQYAVVDASGTQSTPATFTVNWTAALPVVLTGFSVGVSNDDAQLTWTADNQQNFRQYEIERALPSVGVFTKVGVVPANELPSGAYSFTDANAAGVGSIVNYRLKMVDIDGQFSYSGIRSVRFAQSSLVTVTPTVAGAGQPLKVLIVAPGNTLSYDVWLLSATGAVLSRHRTPSQTPLNLPTAGLARGLYFVRVKGGGLDRTIKVTVL